MGGHHDGDAFVRELRDHLFDDFRGRWVERRGWLVEKQHLRAHRPGAGQRKALLLAARQQACRSFGQRVQPETVERAGDSLAAHGAGQTLQRQRIVEIGRDRAAQQDRALEHHCLRFGPAFATGPEAAARCRVDQPVA